jgi:hypothetical protein
MALGGRLICLALICAGLGTVSLATLPAASAAPTGGPTAIAVGPSGTSYVGFASGGRLTRLNPRGHAQGSVPLDQDDPVDGLFVTNAGQIWVDYGSSVSLLAPSGRVLTHFTHRSETSCSGSPAYRYGGITVGAGKVWVADRCDDTMSVYSPRGRLLATVDLPGRGHPRGITFGRAQGGRPDTVYVALPDSGRIVSYRADRIRNSSRPARSVTLRRPGGGVRPQPGGIAIDRFGQLTVADMANNAVYLVDTFHDYSVYRVLGHPPRAGREAGRLRSPSALAQYAQDGGSLSGNLFIADSGNRRVQRWNTSGWTYWVKQVRAGRGTGGSDDGGLTPGDDDDDDDPVGTTGPGNSKAPSVTGTATVGQTLTCNPGSWYSTGGPLAGTIRYTYRWVRGGTTIAGATGSTYTPVADDAGTSVGCVVTATDSAGATTKSSATVVVGGTTISGPVNVTRPTVSGTAMVGSTLTCAPGTWTGTALTYTYRWKRDGTTISGAVASTYEIVARDAGTTLTCVVTATNSLAAADAASAGTLVPVEDDGPVNTSPPTLSGAGTVGSALTCTTGSWSGSAADYAYQWTRDGAVIAHTVSSKYVLLNVDVGTAIGCTVTATNDEGEASASAAARTIASPSGSAPRNLTPVTVSGAPVTGQTLTCDPGTWSGSPTTVMPLWQRDGATVANGSWTYVVGGADSGAALQCVVVAGNVSGLGAARSRPAAADSCSGPTGVEINDGAAETTSTLVTLNLRAPRGTTTVHLSNDPSFASETVASFPAGCTYDWVLPSIPGLPLSWSVYVRYDSSATTYSDSIVVNVAG